MADKEAKAEAKANSGRGASKVPTVTAADVRAIALSLPDSSEKLSWGMPTFRVAGRIFAALGDDDTTIGVKCPKEDRAELIAAEPDKFFVRERHDDNYAWLRVRLGALEDRAELRAILADSWRQAAPKRVAAAHPDLDAPWLVHLTSRHVGGSRGGNSGACQGTDWSDSRHDSEDQPHQPRSVA